MTRDELEELELRLAQVEHRLRLVEGAAGRAVVRARLRAWLRARRHATSAGCRDRTGRRQARLRLLLLTQQADRPARREISPDGDASSERGRRLRETFDEARPDVREVRPAPVHEAGRRAPGHRRRAAESFKTTSARFPFSQVEQVIDEDWASRSSGSSSSSSSSRSRPRPSARCTTPYSLTAAASSRCSGRPRGRSRRTRSPLPGREDREGPRPRARLHRRAEPRGRVRAIACARSSTIARKPATPARSTGTSSDIPVRVRASTGATRARVLTLEFLDGTKIADLQPGELSDDGVPAARPTRWRRPG